MIKLLLHTIMITFIVIVLPPITPPDTDSTEDKDNTAVRP